MGLNERTPQNVSKMTKMGKIARAVLVGRRLLLRPVPVISLLLTIGRPYHYRPSRPVLVIYLLLTIGRP